MSQSNESSTEEKLTMKGAIAMLFNAIVPFPTVGGSLLNLGATLERTSTDEPVRSSAPKKDPARSEPSV